MAAARRVANRLDIILSRVFSDLRTEDSTEAKSSVPAAHIGAQWRFAIEAIGRIQPGTLWVFVARARKPCRRDDKRRMSSRWLG
jgi:hypothetical protein